MELIWQALRETASKPGSKSLSMTETLMAIIDYYGLDYASDLLVSELYTKTVIKKYQFKYKTERQKSRLDVGFHLAISR